MSHGTIRPGCDVVHSLVIAPAACSAPGPLSHNELELKP